MANDRTCKRCAAPLGSTAQKCPNCGQSNPTAITAIALVIALALIVPFAATCIYVLT